MEPEWPFAVELAALPEVWGRLLAVHVSEESGRCRGCWSELRPAVTWPCTLHRAAVRARRITTGG